MKALVLCAGLSTRLGDLGTERPKPLLPVCDVPLVRYALALLRGQGIRDVVVNTHHLADQIVAELGDEVVYSHEQPRILGTGGALRQARALLGDERFFLVNGKIVIDLDLEAVRAHHERVGALATLVVRPDPLAARWGAVDLDAASGRVRGLLGAGEHMFTGVHLVEPALIDRLPQGASDIVREGYLPALARGERLGAYVLPGYFWEHSTPERYLAGNVNVLRGQARLRHPPGPHEGVAPDAEVSPTAILRPPLRIGPGARVEAGAEVGPDVVVGRGARVRSGVRLEQAVLWPEADCDRDLRSAILTPHRRFEIAAPIPPRAGPAPP